MKKSIIRTLLLVILLLLAIVLGKVIGNVTADTPFLSWLGLSASFGLAPATVDLAVMTVTFGLQISLNVAQGILLLVAILLYSHIHIHD